MRTAITALLLLIASSADAQPPAPMPPPPKFDGARVVERPRLALSPLHRGSRMGAMQGKSAAPAPGGGGGCSSGDAWPGDAAFCPDDAEAEILSETGVTVVAPTPPTLPNGVVTTFSGTAADSAAEVNAAYMTAGWAQITLGGNIGDTDPHNAGVGATDVTVYLNGFTMDSFTFGFADGNCARMAFIGPGRIKAISAFPISGGDGCTDLIFHGVKIGQTDNGQPSISIDGGVTCDRLSFTGTVAVGADGNNFGAVSTFAGCNDVFVGNSNWEGGEGSTGSHDDWVLRMGFSTTHTWLVDSMMRGWFKPLLRTNGGEMIMYSTTGCRGAAACRFTQINTYVGNMFHAVDDGVNGIDIEQVIMVGTRWIMGNTLGSGLELWGPETDTDRAWWGGNSYCATNSGIFQESDLTGREAGQGSDDWDLNETYDGVGNDFTYEATVEDCFTDIGGWPLRDADAIDTIDNSEVLDVEDDPHDLGT